MNKLLMKKAKENGKTIKNKSLVYILTSMILPILPLNIVSLAVLQNDVKGLSDAIGALSKRMASAESTLSILEDKYIQKSPTVVGKSSYGTTLPSSGQDGQIFFLLK
jgi:hypothetical protein